MTEAEFIFAYMSLNILFPMLYIIISTGSIEPLMFVWRWITSGLWSTKERVQQIINNVTYSILRLLGHYSFSTYTVVQNGREIYRASSMFYYYPTNEDNVYQIDRAKYDVCKWIDAQCKLYRRQYHGEEPELTKTHNDIYDFILHKVDGQPYTRIHRGDFTGRTHTLYYRPFCKSYHMVGCAELTLALPNEAAGNDGAENDATKESFIIQLKSPQHFFLEKNEILDKKFLQWKLYNEYGRNDVANYIGMPFSNYKVSMFHIDASGNPAVAFHINDSNSILIGKEYLVKVDSVLRCPVFDSNEKQVFDIDGILSDYYVDSERETGDSDGNGDDDGDDDSSTAITDISDIPVEKDVEDVEDGENGENGENGAGGDPDHDPEFEMLEQEK